MFAIVRQALITLMLVAGFGMTCLVVHEYVRDINSPAYQAALQ